MYFVAVVLFVCTEFIPGTLGHLPDCYTSNVTVNRNTMEEVDTFIYLGSTQSSTTGSQANIMHCIALASSVMSSLQQLWRDRHLSLSTKIRVYEIIVLPVLLYACETWTVLAADERRLEAFHMKSQRQISKIRCQDHIRNSEVAARTGLGPVSQLHKTPSEFCLRSHCQAFWRYASSTPSTPMSCWSDSRPSSQAQLEASSSSSETTDGSTSSAGTAMTHHQLTCGEDSPWVAIREWLYGPQRLRVDDDDDNIYHIALAKYILLLRKGR